MKTWRLNVLLSLYPVLLAGPNENVWLALETLCFTTQLYVAAPLNPVVTESNAPQTSLLMRTDAPDIFDAGIPSSFTVIINVLSLHDALPISVVGCTSNCSVAA